MQRTRIITIASIAGVAVAGLLAVGTNLRILRASDTGAVGALSATGEAAPADAAVAAATGPTSAVQPFAIEGVGTVTVAGGPGSVDVERVDASPGWTWQLTQTDPARLQVTLTGAGRTVDFIASADAAGAVTGAVTERGGPAPSVQGDDADDDPGDDDRDEWDGEDHDDDDEDEYEYEDHEEYEYEGHDDDD